MSWLDRLIGNKQDVSGVSKAGSAGKSKQSQSSNGAQSGTIYDNISYNQGAKSLEAKLGIPYEVLTPLIFILIRASVHYAMFEDEYYLKSQLEVLKQSATMFIQKYKTEQ